MSRMVLRLRQRRECLLFYLDMNTAFQSIIYETHRVENHNRGIKDHFAKIIVFRSFITP